MDLQGGPRSTGTCWHVVEIENHESLIVAFLTLDSDAWSALADDVGVIDSNVNRVVLHAKEVVTDRGHLINVEHAPFREIWSLASSINHYVLFLLIGRTVKKSNMLRNCAGL